MTRDFNLGFGHGRWQCLGKAVALRQLGIVIFEVCTFLTVATSLIDVGNKAEMALIAPSTLQLGNSQSGEAVEE